MFAMEIVMNKRLANHAIFQPAIHDLFDRWQLMLNRFTKGLAERWISYRRAEIISKLDQQTLYDIGESDSRPLHRKMPIWNNDPFGFLPATIQDELSELDSRR
jgi:hypothetical protein